MYCCICLFIDKWLISFRDVIWFQTQSIGGLGCRLLRASDSLYRFTVSHFFKITFFLMVKAVARLHFALGHYFHTLPTDGAGRRLHRAGNSPFRLYE